MKIRSSRAKVERPIALEAARGAVFDLDALISGRASADATAWKAVLEAFLRSTSRCTRTAWASFDVEADYSEYVSGRTRAVGVRAFLASRGFDARSQDVARITTCLDAAYEHRIRCSPVVFHPCAVALAKDLHRRGMAVAVVSANRSCALELASAGIDDLVDVRIDGHDADCLGVTGHADPGLFAAAARRLCLEPSVCTAVLESATAVTAARTAGFGLVIGIDQARRARTLYEAGADMVLTDLTALRAAPLPPKADHGRRSTTIDQVGSHGEPAVIRPVR